MVHKPDHYHHTSIAQPSCWSRHEQKGSRPHQDEEMSLPRSCIQPQRRRKLFTVPGFLACYDLLLATLSLAQRPPTQHKGCTPFNFEVPGVDQRNRANVEQQLRRQQTPSRGRARPRPAPRSPSSTRTASAAQPAARIHSGVPSSALCRPEVRACQQGRRRSDA